MQTLFETSLSLPLIQKGKVRDIYDIDDKRMLIVTTDRLSAFDVVFDVPISQKGAVLTRVANFWFDKTQHIIPNHLTHEPLSNVLNTTEIQQVEGRANFDGMVSLRLPPTCMPSTPWSQPGITCPTPN